MNSDSEAISSIETAEPQAKKRSKRRRGNGEGSIFQRATDGRWCGTINIGYNEAGKRRRKTVYGETKKAVQDEMTRLQSRKLDCTLADTGRLTVAAFLAKWLENAAKPTIRETTFVNYKRAVDSISGTIGGLPLAKLTPAHVQGLYSQLKDDGASAYKQRLIHAVLHRALKQALRWGMVSRNPVDAVEPPRVPHSEIHTLTDEQARLLLTTAKGDRLEALYVLALTTGMRFGELAGLQWADVDLAAGCLSIRHALQEVGGKMKLAEPKTAKSRRKIELSPLAVKALWEHRKNMLAKGWATDTVFRNSDGGFIRRSHFHAYCYKPLLEKAGLPDMRFHDLRHTAATLMLSGGEHPKVVQEMLGHSNISMTMDTYSHVLPTMQRAAVDRLGKLLTGTNG